METGQKHDSTVSPKQKKIQDDSLGNVETFDVARGTRVYCFDAPLDPSEELKIDIVACDYDYNVDESLSGPVMGEGE
ncbi:unnamed protein product [Arabis nemorensis]|uniref:Uncharacterized protein n=1 Tax=Arabis nemorensis TaxID=586526 RepID=A0A565CKM6_9BRAS|nr:unnamed protein product [Arabis nemorensis]